MNSPTTLGEVVTKLKIDSAPEGTVYIRAYGTETGAETCYSEFIQVKFVFPLGSIAVDGFLQSDKKILEKNFTMAE